MHVVLSINRIGGGDDRTTCVERSVNTGFRDRDGLLFHYFVNRDSIDFRHFVEFVDTNYSSIGEYHRSCFESSFAYEEVTRSAGGKETETEKVRTCVPVSLSVVTAAVNPTPLEPLPVVAIAKGAVFNTNLNI